MFGAAHQNLGQAPLQVLPDRGCAPDQILPAHAGLLAMLESPFGGGWGRGVPVRQGGSLRGVCRADSYATGGSVSLKLGRCDSLSCRRARFGCAPRQSISAKRKSR